MDVMRVVYDIVVRHVAFLRGHRLGLKSGWLRADTGAPLVICRFVRPARVRVSAADLGGGHKSSAWAIMPRAGFRAAELFVLVASIGADG